MINSKTIFITVALWYIWKKRLFLSGLNWVKSWIGVMAQNSTSNFSNSEFEKLMRAGGWSSGLAWCMSFAKMVFLKLYPNPKQQIKINSVLNNSVVSSYRNVLNDKTGTFKIISYPKIGSIAIWIYSSDMKHGHAGIVVSVRSNGSFETVEGNWGGRVALCQRSVNEDLKFSGITGKLAGFIILNK